jgi:putative membrane protein
LVALAVALGATVGFGIYGLASGAPSTVAYVLSVLVLAGLIAWLRRDPIPAPLAIALAVDAAAHLAGGLTTVGDDVLYNASIGPYVRALHTHVLQYDHLVHAFGTFLAMVTLWTLLALPVASRSSRGGLIVLCALGALGVGAINETVEFVATIAHSGAHVGGYANTGWDLVSNAIGALIGGVVVYRTRSDPETAS